VISRLSRRVPLAVAGLIGATAFAAAVGILAALVDNGAFRSGLGEASRDPAGLLLITGALLGAFAMRAKAWCRLLPELGFWHSLAAVHLALGANHVLPFRLGEPMRIASVVRRTPTMLGAATSTTVLLRAADIVTLVVMGVLAGPELIPDQVGTWAVVAVIVIGGLGVAAAVSVDKQRRANEPARRKLRLPDASTFVLVVAAWLAEAIVVWRAAGWFDIDLSAQQAIAVLAAAVSVQLVAIAPGGLGTYEAAATAALVATGVPVATAVAAAVVVHAVKTIYSLVAGATALVTPQPSILGRLRLPQPVTSHPIAEAGDGPVVLFLPARNEAPRIAAVLAAAPTHIEDRPVELVVVDDGSTDATAAEASAAGATVISHDTNLGLGAAVRTGLAHATHRGASAVAFCDADGEYDPAELADIVGPILRGDAHYVVGSRFRGEIGRMLLHRRLGNQALTRWVRFVARTPISDGQSGYRAFSAAAAAEAEIAHDYNYAQVLTIDLVSKGFGYHEVPITYAFRTTGRSFVRLGTYLRHVIPTVWRQLNPSSPSNNAQPFPEEHTPCPVAQEYAGFAPSPPASH
jgi:uncharacterized membrane protein YbhN (UPF0104 family)